MTVPEHAPRASCAGLCAGYGGRPVLHQLSAEIPGSAMTALVGPNGSGKSTLLAALAGVIRATSGSVEHHGELRPAFVVQRSAVRDALPLTVRQTVAMGRWADRGLWRRLSRRDRAVVGTAMERLGIAHLAGRQLGELSGGQRQRALVAQGLAQESDLLLLDEPGTGLDVSAQAAIGAVLAELAAEGVAVVQATHDLEAAGHADRCLLLGGGRLLAQGHPREVLTDALLARVWQPARPAEAGTRRCGTDFPQLRE